MDEADILPLFYRRRPLSEKHFFWRVRANSPRNVGRGKVGCKHPAAKIRAGKERAEIFAFLPVRAEKLLRQNSRKCLFPIA